MGIKERVRLSPTRAPSCIWQRLEIFLVAAPPIQVIRSANSANLLFFILIWRIRREGV